MTKASQTMQPNATNNPILRYLLVASLLVGVVVMVTSISRRNSTSQRYSTLNLGFPPPHVSVGQHQCLMKLWMMMTFKWPNASRYTVNWDEPGPRRGPPRLHTTAYNPKTRTFWDADALTGITLLRL